MGRNITQILPDIPFQDILIEMDKKGATMDTKFGKVPVSISPIRNNAQELSYLVWIFERPRVIAEVSRRNDNHTKRSRTPDRLKRVFARKGKSGDAK